VLPVLLRELDRSGRTVRSAELDRPTLDDVFLRLTGRSLREENADPPDTGPVPEGPRADTTNVGTVR
jgi:ABC-2 type transport system ATP-binding protein